MTTKAQSLNGPSPHPNLSWSIAYPIFMWVSLVAWGSIVVWNIVRSTWLASTNPIAAVVFAAWGIFILSSVIGTALWAGWPHIGLKDELPPPWVQSFWRRLARQETRVYVVPESNTEPEA